MKLDREKIELIVADKGLKLKDIPIKAGISTATFSLGINGKRNPSCATIGKIAKALKVSAKDIIAD